MSDASYWDVIDPHWSDFCEGAAGRATPADVLAAVPPDVGPVAAAHLLQAEVRNGGFVQYFHNTSGKTAEAAVAGLEAIGMPLVAGAARTAMARLGDPYPAARSARQKALPVARREALATLTEAPDSLWSAFDDEERVLYAEIDRENGGFDAAAGAYFRGLGLL